MESISVRDRSFPKAFDATRRTVANKTIVFFIIVILSLIMISLFVVANLMKINRFYKEKSRKILRCLEFVLNYGQFIKNSLL